jgi:hypothetical protein
VKRKDIPVSGSVRKPVSSKIPLDHILFRGGSDLTAFQSIGLFLIGLMFVVFVGLPIFIYQYARPDQRDLQGMVICGGMTVWGLVMMLNGAVATFKYYKKKRS